MFEDASITGYSQDTLRKLEFYVSNNGLAWERIQDDELPDSIVTLVDPGAVSAQVHALWWRASLGCSLTVRAGPVCRSRSKDGGRGTELRGHFDATGNYIARFLATAVSSSYYSRSALEFGEVCSSGVGGCANPREYIFSSSFSFPGFRGYLRAST